jgi:hypothetical protein
MKKYFLLFINVLIFRLTFSQLNHTISLGPDLGIAANFGKSSKLSLGGSVEYALNFAPKVGIRLHAGYNKFKGKIFDEYVSFLPVRAGVQGFIYQDIFFAFAEGGIATYKSSNPTPALTKFSWAAGLGYNQYIDQKRKQLIQTSVYFNYFKHNTYLNYTWFNIRVAYGLSFGRKQAKE